MRLEPEPLEDYVHFYIPLVVSQTCNGSDGSMLFVEPGTIIYAMYNRYYKASLPCSYVTAL